MAALFTLGHRNVWIAAAVHSLSLAARAAFDCPPDWVAILSSQPTVAQDVRTAMTRFRNERERFLASDWRSLPDRLAAKALATQDLADAQLNLARALNRHAAAEKKYYVGVVKPDYLGEELRGFRYGDSSVLYFSLPEQWRQYRIEIKDGLLYDSRGKLADTTNAIQQYGLLPDPKTDRVGFANFVMDRDGRLYLDLNPIDGVRHHTSILGGAPVASAGEIQIRAGRVEFVSNRSGHYNFEADISAQALDELKRQGVTLPNGKVDFQNSPGRKLQTAEWLGIPQR